MTEGQEVCAKLSTYRITVARTQHVQFEVKALSPENACKRLRDRLKCDNAPDMPNDAQFLLSSWSDPSCRGEEWAVTDGRIPRDETMKTISVWNGTQVVRVTIAPELAPLFFDRVQTVDLSDVAKQCVATSQRYESQEH